MADELLGVEDDGELDIDDLDDLADGLDFEDLDDLAEGLDDDDDIDPSFIDDIIRSIEELESATLSRRP